MKNFLLTLFILFFAAFISSCSLISGPSSGTIDDEVNFIRGTITTSSNTPVANEPVVIKKYAIVNGSESIEKEYRSQTDSNGDFKFTNVDNGYYVLYVGQDEQVFETFTIGATHSEVELNNIDIESVESFNLAFRFTNDNSQATQQLPQAFIPGVSIGELSDDSIFHFSINRTGFYTIVIQNGSEYLCYPISINSQSDTVYLYDIDLSTSPRISAVDVFDFGINMNHVPIAQYSDIDNHLSYSNISENMVTYYITDAQKGLVPYLPGWNKFSRIEIDFGRINSDLQGETVTNYPLLVRLNSEVFESDKSYNNFGDLRFLSQKSGLLRHKIDSWDEDSQTLYVWVIFESLEIKDTTKTVFLNYSNFNATTDNMNSFEEVDNFLAVYPLGDELETLTARDVSGNSRDGALNLSGEPVKGVIGNASSFNGEDDNIHIGNWQLPEDEFSVSLWYKWFGENRRHQVLVSKRSLWLEDHMQWQIHYEEYGFKSVILYNTNYMIPFETDEAGSSDWVYLSFSYSNGEACLYINGNLVGECSQFSPDLGVNADIRIGNSDLNEAWNGLIDEVRFHQSSRSRAWYALDYETQKINQNIVDVIKIY